MRLQLAKVRLARLEWILCNAVVSRSLRRGDSPDFPASSCLSSRACRDAGSGRHRHAGPAGNENSAMDDGFIVTL